MNWSSFISQRLDEASAIANRHFGNVSSVTKEGDNNQVVTQADLEIGQSLIAAIKASFPEHNIIDEEAGVIDKGSDYTWVIDPIDGTSNFATGLPLYCSMIGLLQKDLPIAGGVVLPFFKQNFIAEKGLGAFCNSERIHVTKETNLLNALIAYGIDGHQEDPTYTRNECNMLAEIILGVRNIRISNSLYDGAQVANGRYGGFLNRTTKIWDNVASHIIIEEAGGIYTDFFGKQIDYSRPLTKAKQNFTVCAAAPELHKSLQKIINA